MPFPIVPGQVEFATDPVAPEPTDVVAGDTLSWHRSFGDFPASQGWTLSYVLNATTARIVVASADIVANGNGFDITVPASETKTWTPGSYQWLAIAQLPAGVSPAQRRTVALGRINVGIDLLDATAPQDTRTANEIALANIDAMLSGVASSGVEEYTIHGRMLRRYSLAELRGLRSDYAARVRQERSDRGEYQRSRTVAVHF